MLRPLSPCVTPEISRWTRQRNIGTGRCGHTPAPNTARCSHGAPAELRIGTPISTHATDKSSCRVASVWNTISPRSELLANGPGSKAAFGTLVMLRLQPSSGNEVTQAIALPET